MDYYVFKVNVKQDALLTKNVIAMNVVKVVCVNHFVAVTMIAVMVKCVKTLFVQLDADQMLTAPVIWLVSVKNVLIHVKSQRHAVPMQIVSFKIM